ARRLAACSSACTPISNAIHQSLLRKPSSGKQAMEQASLDFVSPGTLLLTAGIDEAGRGPLAGPVFAAAVILDPARPIAGLADSKTLSAARRERLADEIRAKALAWHVAQASVEEIDTINILHAAMLAMRRACLGLSVKPEMALIDGNRLPLKCHALPKPLSRATPKCRQSL